MEECVFNQRFDNEKMLQYVNNDISVLHCHHYAGLFTKLALTMKKLDGPRLLFESMEESAYLILKKYYISHGVSATADKARIAQDYFGLMGLGALELNITSSGGSARMSHSHVDEGWIKKWSKTSEPLNFMGQGYLAGAFAIIMQLPVGSCEVTETASIVKGDSHSAFTLTRKGS